MYCGWGGEKGSVQDALIGGSISGDQSLMWMYNATDVA